MERVKSATDAAFQKILPHARDRKLYLAFWFCLGAGALAYFIIVAIKCSNSYKSPGASIEIDPTQPPFPIFAICFEDGFNENNYPWDNYTGGVFPTLNPLPTAVGYYNFTGSFFDNNIYLNGQPFYYFPSDVTNYCNYGCNCLQFNHDKTIKQNAGKVNIYGTGQYQADAARSVAYLLVRSQDYGPFVNSTDLSTDENYDILNLPTGTYVDAAWTLSNHISVQSWVPYKESTSTSYAMVQQVETLTLSAGSETLQGLSLNEDYTACSVLPENATCQAGTQVGYCDNSTDANICAWSCPGGDGPIPLSWRCDGVPGDCPSNDADEQNCTYFTCADNTQILSSLKCNGVPECPDGSDERNCPLLPMLVTVSVYPYTKEVTKITAVVTFGWDVALAAFKSVLELGLAAMAFLFPAYFVAEPELRRFILSKGQTASEVRTEMKAGEKSPPQSPTGPPEKVEMESLVSEQV